MTGAVHFLSRDYWFKVVEFLQQNWALIEPAASGVTVYFIDDASGLFDEMPFASEDAAVAALRLNGFDCYAAGSSLERPICQLDFLLKTV
jgi:hypothetical protein